MFLLLQVGLFSQARIGYTNIELVLAYMPESSAVQQSLQKHQQKLGEKLQIKEQYAQTMLQEYMEIKQREETGQIVDQVDLRSREEELQKLEKELQQSAQEAEYEMMVKQQEMMTPVLEKLQKAIDTVAEREGCTYVLNQTTSAGVSTILFGPEEDDLTEAIMKELNIPIPESNQ